MGKIRNVTEIDIDKIIPYQNNAKIHTLEQINLLANAIAEFGFTQPIVIDANRIIIAGHGRYEAAMKMELKKVPVIMADDLTPTQVKAARISDNKLAELSSWDNDLLGTELEQLAEIDYDLEDLGFSAGELSGLIEGWDTDNSSDNESDIDFDNEGHTKEIDPDGFDLKHTCPKCGFEYND
jgi:ParB-like chromosome segregation protein Spo0J